ncbi:MAG: hypothetical protein LKI25_08405 [Atopobiaceae bacterium]|jgi:hypothetical protein|nr:hypothetical protein [Atopobiaceae bacterium]MCI2174209.1 hypothetical protein [Atopobiaceae bacterium]MCI2206850.1 hypothetical protein [Atopobiaceae bacterium]
MPSWNIHTAHVERLLHDEGAAALGIGDVNCFLFGNYLPDVYVGYMVPDTTRTIPYTTAHFTESAPIPVPRADEYWDAYVEHVGCGGRMTRCSDLVLGAWAHLMCDAMYNAAVRRLIKVKGWTPGERLRIAKQGDFDRFGHTLPLTMRPVMTDELVRECEEFPQYPVLEPDVAAAIEAADAIIDANGVREQDGDPDYVLLTQDFFFETFESVNEMLSSRLRERAGELAGR